MLSGRVKVFFGVVKGTRETPTNVIADPLLALGLYFLETSTKYFSNRTQIHTRGFALGR